MKFQTLMEYRLTPEEIEEINKTDFLIDEIRESRQIAMDLRIRDNADNLYRAIAQIKELIEQEPSHPRPYELYQGIRDLATNIVNHMEGRP